MLISITLPPAHVTHPNPAKALKGGWILDGFFAHSTENCTSLTNAGRDWKLSKQFYSTAVLVWVLLKLFLPLSKRHSDSFSLGDLVSD